MKIKVRKLGKGIRIEIKVRPWPFTQYWKKEKLGEGIRIEIKVIPWPFTQYWMKVSNHRYHEVISRIQTIWYDR